jgi:hypothetical protein
VITLDLVIGPDIGRAELGEIMKLNEMFSPIGAPKDDQSDIDWIGDLKFFIDNENNILSNHFFPAVKKHEKYIDHPDAYKLYLKPIHRSLESYCKKFNIKDAEKKFPKDSLIELARLICDEQKEYIKSGDYDEDK